MIKQLFVILFFCSAYQVQAQSVNWQEIDEYLTKTYKEWDIPGMTVGVVKDGELVFSKGYGVLEEGKPTSPNEQTTYAIASNSKAFTATILAMLVDEGKIEWDDKVIDYLPYFEVYNEEISHMVTIKDLLTHRVGLGTFSGDVMWYDANLSTEEIVRRAKFIPKAFNFRDGFGYSNVMYITAGDVIEKVTNKSWFDNVNERILTPLQMNRTVYTREAMWEQGNWAVPHATQKGENVIIRYENWENVPSTGGLISTVEDLSKWVIFSMSDGVVNGNQLLSKQSRNMMWTGWNQFPVNHFTESTEDPDFSGYGFGYSIGEYKGNFRVSHTGGFGGMLSSISMLPDENLAVIMLSNDTESPIRAVPYYIFDRFVDANSTEDYSADMLSNMRESQRNDRRVEDIQKARIKNTTPSKQLNEYVGNYYSDLYGGNIQVTEQNGTLQLGFEHTPTLNATLSHWHYDVFQIHWNETQPWFGFGVVKFDMDTNLYITGLSFNVPNNDFYFEEFKAIKQE